MKKLKNLIIIIVVLITSYGCTNSQKASQLNVDRKKEVNATDSVSIRSLGNIDLHKYVGRQVSLLLNDSLISKYKDYIFIQGKPGLLLYLSLEYSQHLHIEVFVDKYSYIKQFDTKMAWKLDSFKKEKIFEIKIKVNNKILKEIK